MRCPTSAGHLDAVPRKTAGWILERNDEDVGIIRSPLRAIVIPDPQEQSLKNRRASCRLAGFASRFARLTGA
jgi:hypothetical protein